MGTTSDSESIDMRQLNVLYEHIQGDVKSILEAVKNTQQITARIPKIETDVESIIDDMQAFKAALKETNQDLHRLEDRVNQLEAAI